jgi:chorismate synthase
MNSIGHNFRVLTWGESHGLAMGMVIDGCPAGLKLDEHKIFERLQDDVPDTLLGTTRHEPNPFIIISGVLADITLGTPIALIIPNVDVNSTPYKKMAETLRPGHGDFTYRMRFGLADLRGGGRASGRECIARLAAGEIAAQLIRQIFPEVFIQARVSEMAGVKIKDAADYLRAQKSVLKIAQDGDSSGGEVILVVQNLPAGLGSPVFGKLDARLAQALMGIGAVKSVEMGIGKEAKNKTGHECNDSFSKKIDSDGFPKFGTESNNAGGVLAGISNGEDLLLTMAVKPTPTIQKVQKTLDPAGREIEVSYQGRYDKNITPRIVPIAEAMASLVIADELIGSGFIHPTNLALSGNYHPERAEIIRQKYFYQEQGKQEVSANGNGGKMSAGEEEPIAEKILAKGIKKNDG